ncbi:aldehyde dehydrogenase family protein [Zooshikella ganghwensis]|uniref:Aldehyde dehydrogenase n=1 Tax=Zooshikella ganghwensis TaxID=202772 RepID=A0A4P9VJI1_9GAMM|nr:aldehyde dehydrogenase family protein [Zooshikella ganghwensis]RDH43393.1 aldehyde dehydrogenase [Zooshikella ganghwensis]
MIYTPPGQDGAKLFFKSRYANFINGEWVTPKKGNFFENKTPVTGEAYCQIPRSTADDIEAALDAAHQAAPEWGAKPAAYRAQVLLQIADRIEQFAEKLAIAETWDNGKPIRETINADIPLVIDHFRYFAGCIRADDSALAEIDATTTSYHFHEPLGVVGQIIPWNFPLLMAAWKLAPALAAGNCVVLKPAEQTPVSILLLMEILEDIIPPGVVNVVNGFGHEAGKALASSPRIAKLAFTGSTEVGCEVYQSAAKNIIPCTVELGGKSPNIYFADILQQEPSYLDKCVEGLLLAFFNQGEVCTCPSRALVHESIYDTFMEHVLNRAKTIKQGNPLDTETMVGAQVSLEQLNKIMGYIEIGRKEGAHILFGGQRAQVPETLKTGYYVQPTILRGENSMCVFQEEIFGPTIGVTTFKTEEEAINIANDVPYGLGAGVWTRDINRAQWVARKIQAGRVWVNCYHMYPAHAAFGGYKKSGVGRETHKMALQNYQQVKNILVSYNTDPLHLF